MTKTSFSWPILCLGGVLLTCTALADECAIAIDGTDNMRFSTDEIVVDRACGEIELTFHHTGDLPVEAMGHNWVVSTAEDARPVADDGARAGLENQHIRPGDDRVIAHTEVIGGGESTTITFSVEGLYPAQEYGFFCTVPGHFTMMRGTFRLD